MIRVDWKREAVLDILLEELLYCITICLDGLVVAPDDHLVQFCLALVLQELLVAYSFGYDFFEEVISGPIKGSS
jgi:hypothetical protein